MDKELIDRAWRVLPAEFKEEVKRMWSIEIDCASKYKSELHKHRTDLLYELFGEHLHWQNNLTSDAEGEEEMLYVKRKYVQEMYKSHYDKIRIENISSSDKDCYEYANEVLKTLFGSKCLPDEEKFSVGNVVVFHPFKTDSFYYAKIIEIKEGEDKPYLLQCGDKQTWAYPIEVQSIAETYPGKRICDNPLADKEGCKHHNNGKCLFDSACYFEPLNPQEPKPFKYSVGQKVILHFYGGEISTITEAFNDGGVWNKYKVKAFDNRVWNENELGPYDESKPDKSMTEERYQYLNSLSIEDYDNETSVEEQRRFCEYQHKHHPDEVIYLQTHSNDEEPKPAERDCFEAYKDSMKKPAEPKERLKLDSRGLYREIVGEQGNIIKVRVPSEETEFCEPKKKRHVSVKEACEILDVDESEATKLVKSVPEDEYNSDNTDQKSANVNSMVDNTIKDGFREHNRLHIAAMLAAGILANGKLTEWQDIDRETHPKIVKASLRYADALMKAAGKGGKSDGED